MATAGANKAVGMGDKDEDDSAVCELAPETEDAEGLGKPAVTAQAPGMKGAPDVHTGAVVADAALTVAVAIGDGQGRRRCRRPHAARLR